MQERRENGLTFNRLSILKITQIRGEKTCLLKPLLKTGFLNLPTQVPLKKSILAKKKKKKPLIISVLAVCIYLQQLPVIPAVI